ncbi:MAG: sugar phosphate isomerase/epimerase family protein [Clostridia bacterium]
MKYGICTGVKKDENGFFIPHFDFLEKCGFDYYELAINNVMKFSEEEFAEFLKFQKEKNINFTVCCNFIAGDIRLTGNAFDKEKFKNYIDKTVKRILAVGAQKVVLGSGAARNVDPSFSKEKAMEQMLFCIDYAAEVCAKNEITILLEHLNNTECNLLNLFEETAQIMKKYNDKYKKCVIDFYHFNVGNEDVALVEKYKEQIAHVHYAYKVKRNFPDAMRFEEVKGDFEAIKNIGYNDTFSIECTPSHLDNEPEEYVLAMQKIRDFFN